jgi:hypothetical protein
MSFACAFASSDERSRVAYRSWPVQSHPVEISQSVIVDRTRGDAFKPL